MKQRRLSAEIAEQVGFLFDCEEQMLLNYAVALTQGDEAGAKDLVQQTFMAAALDWATVGKRSPDGRRAWLRTTCRNKRIDELRRAGILQGLQEHLVRRYVRTEPDTADVVVSRDALARCWKVLQGLPPAQYQVARLYWIEGHSAPEIARELGISHSGVRAHLSRVRIKIHQLVGPYLNARLADDFPSMQEGQGA
ncbi:RNA polymerase sigma factor [Streptomyces syringium]|uniref:RNA polymerase sigma factor n=1 Tax=Streptomyces syringium TaxID=76729 RepID=UPI0036800930